MLGVRKGSAGASKAGHGMLLCVSRLSLLRSVGHELEATLDLDADGDK